MSRKALDNQLVAGRTYRISSLALP